MRDPVTGWRWRLVLTPAYNAPLSTTTIPAFGAGTRAGIYIPIPARVVFRPPENDDAGYDDRAVGPVELPSLKLSLNLINIKGNTDSDGDGMSDFEDLRRYLVDQTFPNGGSIEGRAFATTMLWTVLTDRGNPNLDVADFEIYFEGVQRKRPGRKWKLDRRARIVKLDAELIHVARYAIETVIADDIATRLQNDPPVSPVRVTATYELLWQNATRTLTLGHTREGPLHNPEAADLYRVVDLFYTISTCVEDVLKAVARGPASFSFDSMRGVTIRGKRVGTPLDVCLFYRQRCDDPTGGKGAALGVTDLWFPGRVLWMDSGTFIAGFLRDDGSGAKQESLFRWGNAWDFLVDVCGPAKMVLHYTGEHHMAVHWAAIQEGHVISLPIGPSNFIGSELEIEEGAGTIRGTTVEPAEGMLATIEYVTPGLVAEPDHTLKLVFTNCPDASPANDEFSLIRFPTRFPGQTLLVSQAGFRGFGLYYLDAPPTITSSPIAIRPHHYLLVHNGQGFRTGDCREYVAPPTIPAGTYDLYSKSFYEQYLWAPIRRCYVDMLAESCLPYAAAVAITAEFSAEHQTLYSGTLSMRDLWWKDLGNLLSELTFTNASGFLWGGEQFFNAIPGRPHVLRVQDNPGECTTKVELLAQG